MDLSNSLHAIAVRRASEAADRESGKPASQEKKGRRVRSAEPPAVSDQPRSQISGRLLDVVT